MRHHVNTLSILVWIDNRVEGIDCAGRVLVMLLCVEVVLIGVVSANRVKGADGVDGVGVSYRTDRKCVFLALIISTHRHLARAVSVLGLSSIEIKLWSQNYDTENTRRNAVRRLANAMLCRRIGGTDGIGGHDGIDCVDCAYLSREAYARQC